MVDRNYDFDKKEFSVKVHFYEFPERWDEWYKETNETAMRIAPFKTYAEEPKDKLLQVTIMHRKKVLVG